MNETVPGTGIGIYIHWPFCEAKCPYCDFNSYVSARIDTDSWTTAYVKELTRWAEVTSDRLVKSVYFGGGTPSLMPADTVNSILDTIQRSWRQTNDPEITLEANPSSVENAKLKAFKSAGVNRVSLGIQALNDEDLRRLGRLHNTQTALDALDIARALFDRVSFDLIYARQHQSLAEWQDELTRALTFQPDHLSLYQLTIEPETAFGARFARGMLQGLPNEDLGADMFFVTQSMCEAAGLLAYEVSNHAKPGQESLHNQIYWRGEDYIGIGPGAHGRVTVNGQRLATTTPLSPVEWLSSVLDGSSDGFPATALSKLDQAGEYLIMSLRTREGMSLQRFLALAGESYDTGRIDEIARLGLLEVTDKRLRATLDGRAVLNSIIRELLPD